MIVNKAGEENLELGTEGVEVEWGRCAGRRGGQACVWLKRGKQMPGDGRKMW